MKSLKQVYKSYESKNVMNKKDLQNFESESMKCLRIVNANIQDCITMFNSLVSDIGTLLTNDFPNDTAIGIYSATINAIIQSRPTEAIAVFILNVYSNDTYRNYILEGNDKFFLNNDYKDLTADNKKTMETLFQFKKCWKKLSQENKDYIKEIMKTLVQITGQYIIERNNGLDITVMTDTLKSKLEIIK